jgi:H+/Na+-translocating ferredoxin:NAD+ oxidoreductase subunit B
MTILFAFLVVGLLGALLGIGLGFASKALAVQKDKRLERIEAVLPGLNCGACGYAGCASYAEAVAGEDAPLTLCSPGGADAAAGLGTIMGVEVEISEAKKVAQVHCRGGRDVSEYEFEYNGLQDCNALYLLYGGDKICKTSCLGLGTCVRVCPVDAIVYDDAGKVWVDKDTCISCGKCIEVCPTAVMKWVPYDADYIVACNNTEPAKLVRKYCKVGCIACKICEKKSPEGGFTVENNLSSINYETTGDRSEAAQKCPPNCIIPVTPLVEPDPEPETTPEPKPKAVPEPKAAAEPEPEPEPAPGPEPKAETTGASEATESDAMAATSTAVAEPPPGETPVEQDGDEES